MRTHRTALAAIVALLGLAPALATPVSAADAPSAAPDYRQALTWLCRPGRQDACAIDMTAMAITASGERRLQPFAPAKDPAVDCFYVYPTVSREPGALADLQETPELDQVVRAQAARFTSRCRLFAPIYRQVTLAGLGSGALAKGLTTPYDDVRAAWRDYLEHDNHGRGVILIGHSQGSILLHELIAREIDGKPAQALLVSAMLAGDPALRRAHGGTGQGAFDHIPLCRDRTEVGCVMGWSTYLESDTHEPRVFGHDADAAQALCVDPAAPGGGRAPLKGYLRKPSAAPAGDPPYVETVGQTTGECVRDAQGTVLRIRVEPGPLAPLMTQSLQGMSRPGWGLHALDVSLVLGDLLDDVDAEILTWQKRR